MGSFVSDQSVCTADLELLSSARRGDIQALRLVCHRFRTPLLAVVLHRTGDWDKSSAAVEPLLEQLCRELLVGSLMPCDWAMRAMELAALHSMPFPTPPDNGSGLEGLGAIARVVKRRALRGLLPQLALPELMSLMLAYVDGRRSHEMTGLIAETPAEAAACFLAAHESAKAALRPLSTAGEAP